MCAEQPVDERLTEAPAQPRDERLFDRRYRLAGPLGHGSSKRVRLAHDVRLDRDVALALVPSAVPGSVDHARLEREMHLTGRLGDHRHIVTVYDFCECDGVPYVTARLMTGGTLADRLAWAPEGRLPIQETVRLAGEVAAGAAHAHAHHVVHRDIKPANIWLDGDGHAALGDFGIALAPEDVRLTAAGAFIGTPAFSAPEQLRGRTVDERADVYSLGIVIYQLLCGAPPVLGNSAIELLERRLAGEPTPPSHVNPEVPPWLDRLVLAMLAVSPDERPRSSEVVACLAGEQRPAVRLRVGAAVTSLQGPLLGRQKDLDRATRILAGPDVRLFTLCGPGGIGKTRLALALADAVHDRYEDGAHVVLLASLRSAEHVPSAIAAALAVEPDARADGALSAVVSHLAPRRSLLVLDNFEHVLEAAPIVAELLARCANLDVVVTSREALRLAAEHRYAVEPLSLPDASAPMMTVAALEQAGATALFLARARALGVDVGGSPEERRAASEVCARLDGVPLAIELAAARAPVLGVRELAARLDSALSALGSGPRDAPPRQRTLRATLDWSHRLLSPAERLALARLSVFSPDCTIEAAATVAGADLETVDSLVSCSLLRRRTSRCGETRLGMLEVVRQYAHERLDERDDAGATYGAHCDHYLALCERARHELRGPDQQRWFDLLDEELPNLRGALRWALGRDRAEAALRLASAIDIWWERSALAEGQAWLEEAVQVGDDAPPAVRAEALLALGFLLASAGATAGGLARVEEARWLARAAGEPRTEADCLMHRSFLETILERPEDAVRTADEARAIATELEDRWLIAMSRYARANAMTAAQSVAAARPQAQQAVDMLRELGDLRHVASLQSDLAYAAILEHDARTAGPLIDEVVEISRRTGDQSMLAVALGNQGLVAVEDGDDEKAAAVFREMLQLCSAHGIHAPVPEALTALAAIAARRGAPDTAATLAGAADGLRRDAPSPVENSLRETIIEGARERLAAGRWDRCRAAGSRMPAEAAVRHAIAAFPVSNEEERS